MRILCAKSGIQFSVEHFPGFLHTREAEHPVFSLSLKQLWKYYPDWQAGKLTETDSYLLFLSLLNATELVDWRVPVRRTEKTATIVTAHMQYLYQTISHLLSVRNYTISVPHVILSNDTADLSCVKTWIDIWETSYDDYVNRKARAIEIQHIKRREAASDKLIRNPRIKPEKYAHLLASWAAEAAEFPDFPVTVRSGTISCSEYWQQIIVACYNKVEVIQLDRADLIEVTEHCEEKLELGSVYSFQLFAVLREAIKLIDGFFSLGNVSFSILPSDSSGESVGESNLQLLRDSAPSAPPVRTDYPTEFAFLRAKMKWSLSK